MKIRISNIEYLFESDSKYANEYLSNCDDITYDEQIEYLNKFRVIDIEFDELIEDGYCDSIEEWDQLSDIDKDEILIDLITQITGEYFSKYDYECLPN
jgi:hypothetical protein